MYFRREISSMVKSKVKSMFGNLKTYTKQYMEDESGMEIIQAVFLVGISAALAVIMIKLFGTMSDGMANTQEKVKNAFTDVNGL